VSPAASSTSVGALLALILLVALLALLVIIIHVLTRHRPQAVARALAG
jgi:hypothetical protein